ncbi:ATP-binding cassette domain-containing protein [Telmatospirillum sp.]|uniref:energy-coupling factor ABC transporter ATP-binding protein n=1 Tax=Telmatospirillum sp. TaxID=2079197 RepID=UPI00283F48A9|nr:ATP-binding cassette domain-containing protein [Telmatospirillum sp.]MDR3440679.1 ATP-binding cassette domain-containing protein [Telmatospirillum sp.]
MTPPLLRAESLTYAYPGDVPALTSLDLTIGAGRRLAILGPNGAGKTTLLLHLNGTLRPASGRILLDGRPAGYDRTALAAWRRRVGLVLQEADDQLFAASVAEDVSFGPINLGLDDAAVRIRVDQALAALGIADLAARPTHMLSFGQKKRVAIAGAVAMAPEILLLDEPTAGLDHAGATHLLAVLDTLSRNGTTLVFSSHDVDLAYSFADDVALFNQGRVLAQGPAAEILADPDLLARAGLEAPLMVRVVNKARSLGLLAKSAPLPRHADDLIALLETIAAGAGLAVYPSEPDTAGHL